MKKNQKLSDNKTLMYFISFVMAAIPIILFLVLYKIDPDGMAYWFPYGKSAQYDDIVDFAYNIFVLFGVPVMLFIDFLSSVIICIAMVDEYRNILECVFKNILWVSLCTIISVILFFAVGFLSKLIPFIPVFWFIGVLLACAPAAYTITTAAGEIIISIFD